MYPSILRDEWGSSPRMRGTLREIGVSLLYCGIIPAYAGNTCPAILRRCRTRDHPRVCGEHTVTPTGIGTVKGSSPRMRGTQVPPAGIEPAIGIIPAYAGNTISVPFRIQYLRDHPRVCGEHLEITPVRTITKGSSPRMRGTPESSGMFTVPVGIIPAYAGNTTLKPLNP